MSFNRRNSPRGNFQQVGNVGHRRPMSGSFVAGGQLTPQKQPVITPSVQQQQLRQPNPQVKQQQQLLQQPVQQQQQPAPQPVPAPQANLTGISFRKPNAEQAAPKQETATPPQQPAVMKPEPQAAMETESAADGEGGGKPATWWRKSSIKLTKKEKLKRRNLRLGKLLQPKNAVMILNEIVGNPAFVMSDVVDGGETRFRATVTVGGVQHSGSGRSKNAARNSAAEDAIRTMLRKQTAAAAAMGKKQDHMDVEAHDDDDDDGGAAPPAEGDGDGDDGSPTALPWAHLASLALHKLFDAWNEEPRPEDAAAAAAQTRQPMEHRPARKMPANPERMQPLMLLNQMVPTAEFTEVGKIGAPPNVLFTYRCTVDGNMFEGSGSNKKTAKKWAAYAACHALLNVQYPPEVWSPPMCN